MNVWKEIHRRHLRLHLREVWEARFGTSLPLPELRFFDYGDDGLWNARISLSRGDVSYAEMHGFLRFHCEVQYVRFRLDRREDDGTETAVVTNWKPFISSDYLGELALQYLKQNPLNTHYDGVVTRQNGSVKARFDLRTMDLEVLVPGESFGGWNTISLSRYMPDADAWTSRIHNPKGAREAYAHLIGPKD